MAERKRERAGDDSEVMAPSTVTVEHRVEPVLYDYRGMPLVRPIGFKPALRRGEGGRRD